MPNQNRKMLLLHLNFHAFPYICPFCKPETEQVRGEAVSGLFSYCCKSKGKLYALKCRSNKVESKYLRVLNLAVWKIIVAGQFFILFVLKILFLHIF